MPSETFLFSSLPECSPAEIELEQALSKLKELFYSQSETLQNWAQILRGYLKSDFIIKPFHIRAVLHEESANLVGFSSVGIILKEPNSGMPLMLVVKNDLVRKCIKNALAISDVVMANEENFFLSETEKGVLSYLILKILHEFEIKVPHSIMNEFQLEGIVHALDHFTLESKQNIACIFEMGSAHERAHIPIFVPLDYVKTKLLPKTTPFHLSTLLARLGHFKKPSALTLPLTRMTIAEASHLALGDLIFFERPIVQWQAGALTGQWIIELFPKARALMKLCADQEQRYQMILLSKPHEPTIEDEKMETSELHQEEPTLREEPEPKGDFLSSLAEKVEATLSVEVSRLDMTLAEIARLKKGSVIPLNKQVGDSLSLVIMGKVIATCEPVHFEGRLAVRIMELFDEKPSPQEIQ